MTTLYLDIFSGISGDMFIGAMLDLGVDATALERELRKLNVPGYHLHVRKGTQQSIAGTKFDVHVQDPEHAHDHDHEHAHEHEHKHEHAGEHPHRHEHRGFKEIQKITRASSLSTWVQTRAIAVFKRIAIAEGAIHGISPEEVHFHEVGAIDSIVDVVGACIALELLGKPRVLASEAVDGTGFIQCAHGSFPVPAPATLAILAQRKVPIQQCAETSELITPTGAALLAEFCESFGPMRGLAPVKVGFGLGTRENKTRPNVLRAILCESVDSTSTAFDWETDTIAVLETNLDNLNPEVLGHALSGALKQGALDVFHTPVQMKKDRPGVVFTILCDPADADRFTEFLLRETTALGVRRYLCERRKLKREFEVVDTPHGKVTVKLGLLNGKVVQRSPEYESCRTVSELSGVPLREVYAAALRAS